MKAYLEYGINLRKGAFDFMRKKEPAWTQDIWNKYAKTTLV
jgi:hypothetical protein